MRLVRRNALWTAILLLAPMSFLATEASGGTAVAPSAGEDRARAAEPASRSRPIPSVKALAEQLPCTLDFFDVHGSAAFLIRPKGEAASSPMPWVWYAPVIGHPNTSHAWMLKQWLEKGIGMAGVDVGESHGSPQGRKVYTALWETLTTRYRMAERACLLPQSRGGLMLYNWAIENPGRVACIAGIYTVCDLRSYPGLARACGAYSLSVSELEAHLAEHNPIDRLSPLAKAGVPILHVHGDADTVVPLEKNSGELARRYRALGGNVRLIVIPGKGHQVCAEFFQCQELVDFVAAHRPVEHAGDRLPRSQNPRDAQRTGRSGRGPDERRCDSRSASLRLSAPRGWSAQRPGIHLRGDGAVP